MNWRGKILHLLSSPLFISLTISLPIYSFFPFEIKKFKTEQVSRVSTSKGHDTYYYDFDHDGNSEKISLIKHPRVGVIVYSKDRVLNQWNFDQAFAGNLNMRYGMTSQDLDNDGNEELILATYHNGKILLHCFDPFKDEVIFRDKQISTYTLINDKINTGVYFMDVYDYNDDGWNEIYYILRSGFSIRPRSMNAYDFKNDTILSSPDGCNSFTNPRAGDIDNDGVPEFYLGSHAVGNCKKDDPYSDHYSWLMVFSPDIEFRFDPVKTGVYPSNFYVDQYVLHNKNYIVGLQIYEGKENFPCYIALFNDKGEIIKKVEFEYSREWHDPVLLPQIKTNTISILKKNGTLLHYDSDLNLVSSLRITPVNTSWKNLIKIDADQDGKEEFIFQSASMDRIFIAQSDFSDVNEIDLQEKNVALKFSLKLTKGKPPEIFAQGDDFDYTFLYFRNPLYPVRFLVFPAIYLIALAFILVLFTLQKMRLKQKYEAERTLRELQLKLIKNQLDPHFSLNLISAIGDLFDKKDSKTSRYVLNKYSTLLRHSVINSDQFIISLPSELEFVDNYLALEKFRFDNTFDFEIDNDGVDENIKIPKMLVHCFAENAVKHGVKYREDGRIEIKSWLEREACMIRIRDNGIGREKSQQITKLSTGRGLSIIDRIIESYNNLMKTRIRYKINDLKDGKGNALGTEVIITVPV